MAFKKVLKKSLNCVELISRNDDALDLEASNIEEYLKDPIANRKKLVFKSGKEPTIFLCNFELSGKEQAIIQDSMMNGLNDDNQPKISLGNYAYVVVRMCLKDIKNPPNETDIIEFKKDGRGYVLPSVMDTLHKCGLVNEIFNHYINLTQTEVNKNIKN